MEITLNGSILYYNKTGNGKKNLLLFHGFGQDHTVFNSLVESLSNQYTCYSFDLFFHGNSLWNKGDQPLQKIEWKEFIGAFLKTEKVEKFSLLGFSIGVKFALATLEAFPEKTEKIILIAPDGIKNNFWYTLATYPAISRKIFKSMIVNSILFDKTTQLFQKTKMLDAGVLRFVQHQMKTEEKRKKVYYSWVVFRHLKFERKQLHDLINQHKIETLIIVGKLDKIIPPSIAKTFVKGLKRYRVEILDCNHHSLIQNSIPILTLK